MYMNICTIYIHTIFLHGLHCGYVYMYIMHILYIYIFLCTLHMDIYKCESLYIIDTLYIHICHTYTNTICMHTVSIVKHAHCIDK